MGRGRCASRSEADRRALRRGLRRPRSGSTRPSGRRPARRSRATPRRDLAIVGGGLSGLWAARARQAARSRSRRGRGRRRRARRRRERPKRRLLLSFLTHGIENGAARFPEEMPTLERLGAGELRRDLCRDRAARDRLRLGAQRRPRCRGRAPRAGVARRRRRRAAPAMATRPSCSTASRYGRRSHSPLFEGGLWRRTGSALVDPARLVLGPGAGRGGPRRADPRADRGAAAGRRARRGRPGHRLGHASSRTGGARDERLPGTDRRDPPAGDPRLGLRPRHRAAELRAAPGDRLGEAPGARRHRQPLPLLAADRRRADPLGRVRRDLPLRERDRPRAGAARAQLRRSRRPFLHRLSAARGGALQPPLGRRDRHLQPFLRLLRHRSRAVGSPTRSGTPASGSAPAASAPRSRSTCSTAARPRRRGCGRSARSRCRSHPSRCAGRRSS